MYNKKLFFFFLVSFSLQILCAQEVKGVIDIDTHKGHSIKIGSSGFNVRIADKSWSYLHPDFRKSVHQLKPGWLRYFSGTMGDAFSSATGQYDIDYAMMFDHSKQYLKGYRFTEVKGPHRIIDLYDLLSEINGKLIVTINGFSETPKMTLELARFCKNNNIEVAVWQFCNEPYFYVPHRERYWWNNGYDYAAKMKPHAEAINTIFPDANLTLNSTWDGIWGFMKEINSYQKENGAYWNVFSKHSYAPHIGRQESVENAYKRGNTKLIEATSSEAMQEIEAYNWKDVPMVITEFGVWNKPLNGIYSSVYNIEYVMRQLEHENTWFVGAHEVSNKFVPEINFDEQIEAAYKEGKELKTDSMHTGIIKTLEGKAYEIYHEVTNHSDFVYESKISNEFIAPGLKSAKEIGCFAQAYRGVGGYDYLVFSNRTESLKKFEVKIDNKLLKKNIEVNFISANSIKVQDTEIESKVFKNGEITILPFSLSVAKWKSKLKTKPAKPTIYKSEILENSIKLTWGKLENVKQYKIYFGEASDNLNQEISIKGKLSNTVEIEKIKKGRTYFFRMVAENKQGISEFSNEIEVINNLPSKPEIFKVSRRNTTATIFWESVLNASGYKLKYINQKTGEEILVEANNVFGYRLENLKYNTPYVFSVAAYNGIGMGEFSKTKKLVLSEKVPLSPRNISAIRDNNGSVSVEWIEQDSVLPNTTYNIYRGRKLHKYDKIATDITKSYFKDLTADKNEIYYYTVKAETEGEESNFYPNTATLIDSKDNYSIVITDVQKQENGYKLNVEFSNVILNGEISYGVVIENISYLTVEEESIEGKDLSNNMKNFEVFIPNSALQKKSKYAIKAFIISNGKSFFSSLPNKTFKTN